MLLRVKGLGATILNNKAFGFSHFCSIKSNWRNKNSMTIEDGLNYLELHLQMTKMSLNFCNP